MMFSLLVSSTINSLPFTHRPTLNDCGGNRITQASLVSRLGNVLLTDQASLLDGLSVAAFAFDQDGLATAEGDIGEGSAGDAAVAPPGLVDDEALDRRCRIAGPVVGLEHAPSATGCSSVPSAAACPQAPPHVAVPSAACHASLASGKPSARKKTRRNCQ